MARNDAAAQTAANSANTISSGASANANGLYGVIAPELETEIAHPAGFGPTEMAQMETAAQQSSGGSQAGTTGQGGLLAARTRNAGGAEAAIASGARSAGKNLSAGVLGTQLANARLKAQQQQEGTSGLENLYNNELGSSIAALGEVAPNVNANVNQQNESWDWTKLLSGLPSSISYTGSSGSSGSSGP